MRLHGVSKPSAFVHSSLRVQYAQNSLLNLLPFSISTRKLPVPSTTQAWRLDQNPFQVIVNAGPVFAAAVAFEQYDASPPPMRS